MYSHAPNRPLFYCESPHLFGVMLSKLQVDIALPSSLADQFHFNYLNLGWLILLQMLFVNLAEQALLIFFERFVLFVLIGMMDTRLSMSARLTLKFWTGALVLEGSWIA